MGQVCISPSCPGSYKSPSPNNAQAKPCASLAGSSSPIFIELGSINNSRLPPPSSFTHTALCFYIYLCPRTGQTKMQGPVRSQHPIPQQSRLALALLSNAPSKTPVWARPPSALPPSSFGCLPTRSPQLPVWDSGNALFLLVKKRYVSISISFFLYAFIF